MRIDVRPARGSIALLVRALGAALAVGAPIMLHAQAPTTDASATGASLPAALRATVDRLADSARVLGVPPEPLYLKAAEGVLKGASNERVGVVVARLLAELREARRGLGTDVTIAELVAGASVVHAGMDAATLQRVRAARRDARTGNSLVMPLVVLADLVARRVTPDIATASVTALAARGAADEEFADLRSTVEQAIGRGSPPDAATRARTAILLRGPRADVRRQGPPSPLDSRPHP